MNEITADIREKIHTIRGKQVILDEDLSGLYRVEVKQMNRTVKRNIERFPEDFLFQLTEEEYRNLRCHFGTLRLSHGKHRKFLPYAFTEQGVAMLAGLLRSKTAIEVNIRIMRAFVEMRRFIAANAQVFHRLDDVEVKLLECNRRIDKVFEVIEQNEVIPKRGVFYDGQVFDAHKFVSDIVRSAKRSIVLIDNYVDESVLALLSKKRKSVDVTIYTRKMTEQLSLDVKRFDSQYPTISVKEFRRSHDRFMIVDNDTVYHIGASLKDLGKKWFAFSRLDKEVFGLLEGLRKSSRP